MGFAGTHSVTGRGGPDKTLTSRGKPFLVVAQACEASTGSVFGLKWRYIGTTNNVGWVGGDANHHPPSLPIGEGTMSLKHKRDAGRCYIWTNKMTNGSDNSGHALMF
jgi:hypothetical protein